MTTEKEKRGGLLGVEVRNDAESRTLVGYAAIFNSDAMIGDYFIERIAPGAFDGAMSTDVRALFNHDTGRVLGRTTSGTLRLAIDSRGLKVEIDVPDTSDGNDLWELVKRKDVTGMSFGFDVTRQEWDDTGSVPVRTILAVDLYEVSPCTFPAYDGTSIALRSLGEARAKGTSGTKEAERRMADAAAARRRIAEREARHEQRIRGIRQEAT